MVRALQQPGLRFAVALCVLVFPLTPTVTAQSAAEVPASPPPEATGGLKAAEDSPSSPTGGDADGDAPSSGGETLETLREKLASEDRESSRQAAAFLLQAVYEAKAKENGPTREFLLRILSAEALQSGEIPWKSARIVLGELATRIPCQDVPFSGFPEAIFSLVGVGPPLLQQAVTDVLGVVIAAELASGESASLKSLRSRLDALLVTGDSASKVVISDEAVVRHTATILWKADPRQCIGGLIEVLARASGLSAPSTEANSDGEPTPSSPTKESSGDDKGSSSPAPPAVSSGPVDAPLARVCREELRRRLGMTLSSPTEWRAWWSEIKDQPVEEILADCRERSSAARLAMWQRLMDRLRETGDATHVLEALQDSLQHLHDADLRVATVESLGRYARWIEDLRMERDDVAALKAELLARGVELVLDVVGGQSERLEPPEVVRAGLLALQKYRSYLQKTSAHNSRVKDVLLGRLEEFRTATADGAASMDEHEVAIYLETVRAAGVLRVQAALSHIQGLLTDATPSEQQDLELLATAVRALGRLAAEQGMSMTMAETLIRLFGEHPESQEKTARDFRRACMTALGEATGNVALRTALLNFYRGILSDRQDMTLRVPAILGLGKLVQSQQEGALAELVKVLEERSQHAPEEVRAAVDCIASYGGPQQALGEFVRFLPVKDNELQDYLRAKVQGLVESQGLSLADLASERLVALWLESGRTAFLAQFNEIFSAGSIKELLDPKKVDVDDSQLVQWWNTVIRRLFVHDLLGEQEKFATLLGALDAAVAERAPLKEKLPQSEQDLTRIKSELNKRQALEPKLADLAVATASLMEELEALWRSDSTVLARCASLFWWERALKNVRDAERLDALRKHSLSILTADNSDNVWKGLPAKFRDLYLARLRAVKVNPQPSEDADSRKKKDAGSGETPESSG